LRVLREYLALRGRKWWKAGEDCIMNSFIICMLQVTKSRRMRWVGLVSHMGEMRNSYIILVGKPGGKRPLGRPRRR
jgi:hypothetical protein